MEIVKFIYLFAGLFFGISLTSTACALTILYFFKGD
jgi:hypothetical protein